MASENETVADIVREMREDDVRISARETPKTEKLALSYACDWCKGYANRIEAAHKREVAELREYLKANSVGVKAMHEEIEILRGMITNLRAKLKVAEDALTDAIEHVEIRKNNEYDDDEVVSACDKSIAKCNNALAAIREQGGGKPIRNCDRFETAEDAYNACPQFCDIDVKTMTDRELKIVEAITKCLEWLFAPIAEGGAK